MRSNDRKQRHPRNIRNSDLKVIYFDLTSYIQKIHKFSVWFILCLLFYILFYGLIEGVFFHLTEIDANLSLPYPKQHKNQLTFSDFLFDLSNTNTNKEGFEENSKQQEQPEESSSASSASSTSSASDKKTIKEIVISSENDAMRKKQLDDFQNLEVMKHIKDLQNDQKQMKQMIEENKKKTDDLIKEKEEAEDMAEEKKEELDEKMKDLQKQKKKLNT